MKQSNLITRELENVEKSNTFDIESVTIESKTATKLSEQKILAKSQTKQKFTQ